MYLVKTYLDRSAIQGVGVFAGEDIKKDTIVWEFTHGIDQAIDEALLDTYSPHIQSFLKRYAFWSKGKMFLCGDTGKYTNHSDTPNTGNTPDSLREIALRDIKKGEEITSDYRTFDDQSKDKLDFEVKS